MVFWCTELSAGGEKSVPTCHGEEFFVLSRSQMKPKVELFSPPWIRTDPITAVILEPQWELNLIGYWFSVTVCWNLASHSRDAVGMGATSNHDGLLKSFTSSFRFPMGKCLLPCSNAELVWVALRLWPKPFCTCWGWTLSAWAPFVALPHNFCSTFLVLGRQEETGGIHGEDGSRGAGWRNSFPVETMSPASVVWDSQKKG